MDEALFEQLLHEEESPTLDFKRDQYLFANASDEEKSEILKDIVGFANAWRRSEAYILIGVEDVRGFRATVIGVPHHLDDHSLQQFVNNQTNRPVQFHYEAFGIDGKQVGCIRIEKQERPFYLKKDYGKLRKNEVYVRRGSSTDPQKPASIDEIAQMGRGFETVEADLNGLALEIEWNAKLSARLVAAFQKYIEQYGLDTNVSKPSPVPPQRFRLHAMVAYLQRPLVPDKMPPAEVERYWEIAALCNGAMDKVIGLSTVDVVDRVVKTVMAQVPEMTALGDTLLTRISDVLGTK